MILISINIVAMELDLIWLFFHTSSGTGRNSMIFRVYMSLSTKIDNGKKYVLNLGKVSAQGLEHHCLQKNCIQLILLKVI